MSTDPLAAGAQVLYSGSASEGTSQDAPVSIGRRIARPLGEDEIPVVEAALKAERDHAGALLNIPRRGRA